MMIEDYKGIVLHEPENATNENEVEKIINSSIKQFPEEHLYSYLVVVYLHVLQNGLEHLPGGDMDSFKRRNIRHALNLL